MPVGDPRPRAGPAPWSHADAVAAEAIATVLAGHGEPTEPAVARDVVAGPARRRHPRRVVVDADPRRRVVRGAPTAGLRVLANRGANGIDGVVSTAVGVALARRRRAAAPTALLIGDVAFLHDTNGLLGAGPAGHRPHHRRGRQRRRRHLLVPAAGRRARPPTGSSSSSAPPTASTWPASPPPTASACRIIERQADVAPAVVESAAAAGGVHVILVRTDRPANVAVHDELHAAVAAALA